MLLVEKIAGGVAIGTSISAVRIDELYTYLDAHVSHLTLNDPILGTEVLSY